jgi:hypothetical protein
MMMMERVGRWWQGYSITVDGNIRVVVVAGKDTNKEENKQASKLNEQT